MRRGDAILRAVQLWTAFLEAGWVGKSVLAILLILSIISWAVTITVWQRFRASQRASRRFIGVFRKAKRLADVQSALGALAHSSLVGLFRAGYAEIEAQIAHSEGGRQTVKSLDSVERSLIRATRIESARLSKYVPFLATTAAAAPFIGLFGTVWGILISFRAIGQMQTVTLQLIAPLIAEALFATAIGLVAAIPAVMAYNYFVRRIRVQVSAMETFEQDYLNIIRRHFLK